MDKPALVRGIELSACGIVLGNLTMGNQARQVGTVIPESMTFAFDLDL